MDKKKIVKAINFFAWSLVIIAGVAILGQPTAKASMNTKLLESMCNVINRGVSDTIASYLTSDSNLFNYCAVEDGNIIGTVFDMMLGVGFVLSFIYGFARMFTNLERGMDPFEAVMKTLREVFLASFFMVSVPEIMTGIMQFGSFVIEFVLGAVENNEIQGISVSDFTGTPDTKIKWGIWLVSLLALLLPFVLSLLMCVAATFQCFSLLLEVAIRRAFAPLAVANIYGEGMRSPGARYLLRYLAVYLKMAIALFACIVGVEMMNVITEGYAGKTQDKAALEAAEKTAHERYTKYVQDNAADLIDGENPGTSSINPLQAGSMPQTKQTNTDEEEDPEAAAKEQAKKEAAIKKKSEELLNAYNEAKKANADFDSNHMANMLMYLMGIAGVNLTVVSVMSRGGEYANDIVGA